jgi:hypothetical protein
VGRAKEGLVLPPREIPATLTCPTCSAPLTGGQNFCGKCGTGAATGTKRCNDGACATFSPGDARFCVSCGNPFGETTKPALRGETVWARTSSDLMARIEVRDVEGVLKKGVVIEHGTEALFLMNGKLIGPLEPGRHDIGGLLKRFMNLQVRYEATAVVYDNSEFSLSFKDVKALTKENAEVIVDCELRMRVEDASKLFVGLAKGATQYPRSALQDFLAPEIANGLLEAIRPHGVQEFREFFSLKREFDLTLAQHLRTTLEHNGLALSYLRTLNYRQEQLDAQNRRIAEYFFQATGITVEAEGRKQLVSANTELLGATAQELGLARAKVGVDADNLRQMLPLRLAFLEGTRNLLAADLENENILAELRQKYDMAQVSRDMSFDQFIQQARLNKENAIRMLEERLQQEYRQLTVLNQTEMARLTGAKRIVEVDQEQKAIRAGFDAEIDRAKVSFDFEMEKGSRSQDLLAKVLQVNRESELASTRGQMDIRVDEQRRLMETRVAEQKGMAEVFAAMKDVPPEIVLTWKDPAQFAEVLKARAGTDLVTKFLGQQLEQQKGFLVMMQDQAKHSISMQAQVAAKASERPAGIVFGPPMATAEKIQSNATREGPPVLWCPNCQINASAPDEAKCPKCNAVLTLRMPPKSP